MEPSAATKQQTPATASEPDTPDTPDPGAPAPDDAHLAAEARAARAIAEADRLRGQLAHAHERLLESERARAVDQGLRRGVEDAHRMLEEARDRLVETEEALQQAGEILESERELMSRVYGSLSWRITTPLRVFKRLRGPGPGA